MQSKPWLSVLIPTFNGTRYLSQALDSVCIQNDADLECLAVDDGSEDGTLEVLKSYQNKIPLYILYTEKDQNWTASVNFALRAARGEYICILHQDDMWMPGRLAALHSAVELYPAAVLFLHPAYFLNAEGKRIGYWNCPLNASMNPIKSESMIERLLIQNFISMPAPLFKRTVAIESGGMDESLRYTGDWDLWLKLSERGDTVYLEKPLSFFRVHDDAQTLSQSLDLQKFRKQLECVFHRHFATWQAPSALSEKVWRVGLFSIYLNTVLAAYRNGYPFPFCRLIVEVFRLGPSGVFRYFRDSRIHERIFARIGLKP
jgi:glycosyltransferase involved in cell wall biosynthesis